MTNVYDVGDQALLTTTVTVNGTPTDATVTLTVTAPDNTTTTPAVTHAGTGTYTATVPVTQAGLWLYVWTSSGAALGVDQGQFTARPTGLRIISLGEAKAHLNKSAATTTDDEELRSFIDSVQQTLEDLVGPIIPRTISETHNGGRNIISLDVQPVISVTSVVETWGYIPYTLTQLTDLATPGTGFDFTFDQPSGCITRRAFSLATPFPPGARNVAVTYLAGRTVIPENFRLAYKELLGHLWRNTQLGRGGARPGLGGGDDTYPTTGMGVGYAIPNRVLELLGRRQNPGLA